MLLLHIQRGNKISTRHSDGLYHLQQPCSVKQGCIDLFCLTPFPTAFPHSLRELSALLIHQPKQHSAPALLLSVLSSFLLHLAEEWFFLMDFHSGLLFSFPSLLNKYPVECRLGRISEQILLAEIKQNSITFILCKHYWVCALYHCLCVVAVYLWTSIQHGTNSVSWLVRTEQTLSCWS